MADSTLHNLNQKTTLIGTDELYLVQSPFTSGNDRRVAFSDLMNSITNTGTLSSLTVSGTSTLGAITATTISGSSLSLSTPLPLASGGTAATSASTARTSLGLVIGTNVQAYNANLTSWAAKTVPTGTVVGTTDTQALTNKDLTATNNSFTAASTTQSGVAEASIASEVNTGTDAARYVSPDSLAGSNLGTKVLEMVAFDYTTDTATGDGKAYCIVPACMGGMDLVAVNARVITAGTTNTTDIQIANVTQAADMLSTKMTIDSAEVSTTTAAVPPVIDTSNDDVAAYDLLRIDVDAVSTTAAKGLIITLEFRLP